MAQTAPIVGDFGKVFLPGESPWAECLAVLPGNKWIGRIANVLVATSPELRRSIADKFGALEPLPQLHNYSENDLVIFELVNVFDDIWNWRPSTQQIGPSASSPKGGNG